MHRLIRLVRCQGKSELQNGMPAKTAREIDAEAADWAARVDRGVLAPDQQQAFQFWLAADERQGPPRIGAEAETAEESFEAVASGLGVALLVFRKGVELHRIGGWIWTALMAATAISSFWITSTHPGRLSQVHVVSALTVVLLPMGVIAARAHRVKLHRGLMYGLFFGVLLMEAASALLPGRTLHQVFLG